MSVLWRLAFLATDDDGRQEFRELAREGEALLVALGGTAPNPGAASLTADRSASSAFSTWTDQYSAAVDAAHAMPLGDLFAGVSGWDPRNDAAYQLAAGAASSADQWPQIMATLRARRAPRAVVASADWFASRAVGLTGGSEPQQTQARIHRAWWSTYARSLPEAPADAPSPAPSPTSGESRGSALGPLLFAIALGLASRYRRGR